MTKVFKSAIGLDRKIAESHVSGLARMGTVTGARGARREVVRVIIDGDGEESGWYPSAINYLDDGTRGVVIPMAGGGHYFLPFGSNRFGHLSNQTTLQVNNPNRLEITSGLKLETAIDGARISVDSDVMARRDFLAANYPHWDSMAWNTHYGTLHYFASNHHEDPVPTTTSIDINNPRWIGAQHSFALPPGRWAVTATLVYTQITAGPGMGISLHFQFRGANHYTTQYQNPAVKVYNIFYLDITTTNPNWETIYYRPGFSGAWAAGTTVLNGSVGVTIMVRSIG